MVVIENVIYPKSTAYWFEEMRNCNNINVANLNMSKCTNAASMFDSVGRNSTPTITGCNNFESGTSTMKYVENMGAMFSGTGYDLSVNIDNLSTWKPSSCKSMTFMFGNFGREGRINLSMGSWDVSKVQDFSYMFRATGKMRSGSSGFTLGALQNWNTVGGISMAHMFSETGKYNTGWWLDLSGWNVNNVTNHDSFMSYTRVTAPRWVR